MLESLRVTLFKLIILIVWFFSKTQKFSHLVFCSKYFFTSLSFNEPLIFSITFADVPPRFKFMSHIKFLSALRKKLLYKRSRTTSPFDLLYMSLLSLLLIILFWPLESNSHLPDKIIHICFKESPLKMMKNAFYFISKALFILKIFNFLSWLFGHVEKQLD